MAYEYYSSGGSKTKKPPTYTAEAYPTLPTYVSPAYDYEQELQLTREAAAPFAGQLEKGLQQAYGQAFSDPFKRERAYGEAMEGFGKSLTGIMSQASQIGAQKYGQKYAGERETAGLRYAGEREKALGDYEARRQAGLLNYKTLYDEWLGKPSLTGDSGGPSWGWKKVPGKTSFMPEVTQNTTRLPTQYSPQYFQTSLPETHNVSQPGYGYGDLPISSTPIIYGAGSEEAYKKAMKRPLPAGFAGKAA